jgi:hypothetical protein
MFFNILKDNFYFYKWLIPSVISTHNMFIKYQKLVKVKHIRKNNVPCLIYRIKSSLEVDRSSSDWLAYVFSFKDG